MQLKSSSIFILLCPIVIMLSCNSSDNPPVFNKEKPLETYLTSTGFSRIVSQVDDGDYEFGLSFKPLVTGNITDIIVKIPDNRTNMRVTIWDSATKTVLRTETIATVSADVEVTKSITPLALTKDKEYMITFNSDDWYNHDNADGVNATYPVKAGNISITGYGYWEGPEQTYPDSFQVSYYAGDLHFNFQQTK